MYLFYGVHSITCIVAISLSFVSFIPYMTICWFDWYATFCMWGCHHLDKFTREFNFSFV